MIPHWRNNSSSQESPVSLEKGHLIRNYKKLKEEMEPNDMIDFLFQQDLLDTDENTHLLHQCRARQCDIILRKLILNTDTFIKFSKHLNGEFKSMRAFQCFRFLSCGTSPYTGNHRNEVRGKSHRRRNHHHYNIKMILFFVRCIVFSFLPNLNAAVAHLV